MTASPSRGTHRRAVVDRRAARCLPGRARRASAAPGLVAGRRRSPSRHRRRAVDDPRPRAARRPVRAPPRRARRAGRRTGRARLRRRRRAADRRAAAARRATVRGAGRHRVDWQPCTRASVELPVGLAAAAAARPTATVTTADRQPVDLRCRLQPTRAARSLRGRQGARPRLARGLRYTPAPASPDRTPSLPGQQRLGESELDPVTIFVVPRGPPPPRTGPAPPPVAQAPFLTARATPRLDRRRRALVRLSCDQACTFAVRLTARSSAPSRRSRARWSSARSPRGRVLSLPCGCRPSRRAR